MVMGCAIRNHLIHMGRSYACAGKLTASYRQEAGGHTSRMQSFERLHAALPLPEPGVHQDDGVPAALGRRPVCLAKCLFATVRMFFKAGCFCSLCREDRSGQNRKIEFPREEVGL